MTNSINPLLIWLIYQLSVLQVTGQESGTYCNPLNLDYTYAIVNSHNNLSYRSGADPAVVSFRGAYYMFVTRSMGYWSSDDLTNWRFVEPQKWYFQGSNAPAAFNYKDSVPFVTGDPSGVMSLLYTDDPLIGDWQAVPAILWDLQDPAFFIDDDDRSYIFWGSSNKFPIRGYELDTSQRFIQKSEEVELFNLDESRHGWERFGENHDHPTLEGYMEGAWLTKYQHRYYMQYAAPGTEWDTYADGVYLSDHPLGPYQYAPHNPISYKPGGFINGAGHGSIVQGPGGQYWHYGTMAISVNYKFERRIAAYPAFFDEDGWLYVNTSYGDYPHYAPNEPGRQGAFRGWMLLSYQKAASASSHLDDYVPGNAVDEQVKTFWVAQSSDSEPWLQVDLEAVCTVNAIQINYHDYQSDLYGKVPGLHHQYRIEGSVNGTDWFSLIDKSQSQEDAPNDYQELNTPAKVRFVRFSSIHIPTGYLAISGLRIFGTGTGKKPSVVKNFQVTRDADRRNATLTWTPQKDCQGYNIRWGISPDKLYHSWLVYHQDRLEIRSLNIDQPYYFAVEGFNENGISPLTETVKIE